MSCRNRRLRRRAFTFIEVLIAIAVLGLALGATLGICGQSRLRLLRAGNRWLDQHATTQAAEYLLLAPVTDLGVPSGLLPPGYVAKATVEPIYEQLPDFANEPLDGWILVEYHIIVTAPDGSPAGEQHIRKMIPKEAL